MFVLDPGYSSKGLGKYAWALAESFSTLQSREAYFRGAG